MECNYQLTKFRDYLLICWYEFLGSAILVTGINLSQGNPVGVAFSLFIALQIGGKISGGHFNPAVTLSVFINLPGTQGQNVLLMMWILVSQFAGGLAGGLIAYIADSNRLALLQPQQGVTDGGAFFIEIIVTWWFAYVIMIVKDKYAHLTNDDMLATSTIALSLMGSIYIGGPVSGGCYNPQVGLALQLWQVWNTGDIAKANTLWIYILSPFIGGAISGIFFKIVHKYTIENFGYKKD